MSPVLMAVGDTAPFAEPPKSIFEEVKPVFNQADWSFAQVERVFSTRGAYNEASMGYWTRLDPHLAEAYEGTFNIVSLATNHACDWGPDPLVDSLDTFHKLGLQTIGAGSNIEEARKPVLLEKDGIKIAMLGYCSVLMPQYWATETRPGTAPLRARTYFEPWEYEPGSPARVVTVADEDDMDAMCEDIAEAKQIAEYVFLSIQWGVHFMPRVIADYQKQIAKRAAAAGVTAIIGHGAHDVRGIEVIDQMICFYSLGNFCMSSKKGRHPMAPPEGRFSMSDAFDFELSPTVKFQRRSTNHLSGIARFEFSKSGVSTTILPTFTDEYPRAKLLTPDNPKFAECYEWFDWASAPVGGDKHLKVEGDHIAVTL